MAKTKAAHAAGGLAVELKAQSEAIEALARQIDSLAKSTNRMLAQVDTSGEAREIQDILQGIRSGEVATYPSRIVAQLIDGENPVRVFRKFRRMTGEELAAKAGISRPYLTQIETGKREPMFPVMVKIAAALEVSLDELVPGSAKTAR
ncbi:helix-turn-helix domain-containing protein [Dongia sp.]|uniref:helix-turn-helix domain-containing protein n=1 Tax=Dongia sp. TaxID=1977262 RepID=UPI0035B47B81